jgi:hypothetical protein
MHVHPRLLPSLAALTDAAGLSRVLGRAVEEVRVEPLPGVGYSNASLSRVEVRTGDGERRRFVLKRTRLDADWTACRTEDARGREALLLGESALAPVWDIFACPYVAFAAEPGEIGLLLRDLTPELLPDAREPLSDSQEGALLGALAGLHARFWNVSAPAADWLVRPAHYCDMLAPSVAADPLALAVLSPDLQDTVPRGWVSALARLPAGVARHLTRPGLEWERAWADLPRTLLHGDVKVANLALQADGRVAAFDWAVVGSGPCTIDLGWYLAVNASRLTGSKEKVTSRYRALLETALGECLPDRLWSRLEGVVAVCGARMLLWSKALALDLGRAGAEKEWNWWVDRLAAIGTGFQAL